MMLTILFITLPVVGLIDFLFSEKVIEETGKVAAQKIRIISSELDKEIKNIEDLYKN